MNRILLIILLSFPLVAQQSIKSATITLTNGQTLNGEVSIIEQSNSIKLVNARGTKYIRFEQVESVKDKKKKIIWTLYKTAYLNDGRIIKGIIDIIENNESIQIINNDGIQYFHFEIVKNIIDKDEKIIWSYNEWMNKQIEEHIEAVCDSNKTIKVLVMPFKNDFYGISHMVEESYDSVCYDIVENIGALEYLSKENIKLDEINDYYLLKAGRAVSSDIIIYGYTYIFNIPYKYSPITSDPLVLQQSINDPYIGPLNINDPYGDAINSLMGIIIIGSQKIGRARAISKAGSYINLTYFVLNLKTGEKLFILKNKTVMKVG